MLNIPTSHRVALLIDADNVQLGYSSQLHAVAKSYGKLKICRAYGDWKRRPLNSKHTFLCDLNIKCIQVDRIGKDSSDKQLIIEACETLYKNQADLFIIVSGDADFRQLVEHIQQVGRKVIGIGNKGQASNHLKKTCDGFHHIEELGDVLVQLQQSS